MKTRIISGIACSILVVLVLILRNTIALNILIAISIAICLYESLIATKIVKSIPILMASFLFSIITPFFNMVDFFPVGLTIVVAYILVLFGVALKNHSNIRMIELSYSFMMTMLISFSLSSIVYLNNLSVAYSDIYENVDGLLFVMLAMLGAWMCDTGAYFIGSKYGNRKLAPTISPKKTVEGAVGGVVSVVVSFLILGLIWSLAIVKEAGYVQFGMLILFAILLAIAGMMGDLFFSLIKRICRIKDFGNLIPGHGGLLDRVDSLIVTAPIACIFLMYVPLIVRTVV